MQTAEPRPGTVIEIQPNYSAIFSEMLRQFSNAMQAVLKMWHRDDLNAAIEPLSYLNIALNACSSTADLERLKDALQRELSNAEQRRRQLDELDAN